MYWMSLVYRMSPRQPGLHRKNPVLKKLKSKSNQPTKQKNNQPNKQKICIEPIVQIQTGLKMKENKTYLKDPRSLQLANDILRLDCLR